MEINTSSVTLSFAFNHTTENIRTTNNDFAKNLQNNKKLRYANDIDSSFKNDLAEIKEKGILKYAQEQREAKLREKILNEMGITEEELALMSLDQRAQIEEIIAEEIKKRMAAESELNGDRDPHFGRLAGELSAQGLDEQIGMKNAVSTMEMLMEKHMLDIEAKSQSQQLETTIERLENLLKKAV